MPAHIIVTIAILFGCMIACYFSASRGVSQIRKGGQAVHCCVARHSFREHLSSLQYLYALPHMDAVVKG